MSDDIKKYIKEAFNKLNIKLNDEKLKKIDKYISFLIQENKKHNLTAIKNIKKIVQIHFLDSAAILNSEKIKGRVIDVGTGAGFPGFVFKILIDDINLTLLESNLKKVNFLKMLQIKLDMFSDIEVIHSRAEELGHYIQYRKKYDVVTSRAVAPLNILLEYTAPFCEDDGKIILYKGPAYKKELEDALDAIEKLNLKLIADYKLKIPNLTGKRYLLKFIRVGNLDNKFPRRPGIPKKRPL